MVCRFVLILILLEVTQILSKEKVMAASFEVLILILLEVTQMQERVMGNPAVVVLILILLEVTQIL